MPTYEYRCPEGHEFELFQRMSDEPKADCPECGAEAERVLSGGAGFLFKGEGFYITDYRSEEYRKKASAEKEKKEGKGGASKADSSGASSGDSKGSSESGGSGSASGGSSTPSSGEG